MDAKNAAEVLRLHDTFIGKSNGNGVYRSVSNQQANEIADLITDQEKYAKLGRLAEICVRDNGCEGNMSNNDYCLFCFMRPYCNNRAELLAEVQS